MRCTGCDYEIPDGVKFCPLCGARQPIVSVPAPVPPPPPTYGCGRPTEEVGDSTKFVGFGGAIILYFKNYFNFRTRSTRSEYWFAYLFVKLVGICCWLIGFVLPGVFSTLATLVFFIPDLAITYRRFHDTGRSGLFPLIRCITNIVWDAVMGCLSILALLSIFGNNNPDIEWSTLMLLILFVFILGAVPLGLKIYEIVICCLPSQPHANKYGKEPRY